MPSSPTQARALARRLIALEESRPRNAAGSAEAAPLEACYQLHLSLCRFVGSIGCETLSARALQAAQLEHPVLRELTVHPAGRPYFEGVDESLGRHDATVVAAGLEAFLTSLVALLARFIGDEVVVAMTRQALHPDNGDEPVHR